MTKIKRPYDAGVLQAEAFWREWLPGMVKKKREKNRGANHSPACRIFGIFGRVENYDMSCAGVFYNACFICREVVRKFRSWQKYRHAHLLSVFYFRLGVVPQQVATTRQVPAVQQVATQ